MIWLILYPTVTWPITNLCPMDHLAIRLWAHPQSMARRRRRRAVRQRKSRDVSLLPHSSNPPLARTKIRAETLTASGALVVVVKISNRHTRLPPGSGVASNEPPEISNRKRQVYEVRWPMEEPKITYHYRKSTSQQQIQIHFVFLVRLYSLQMIVNSMRTRALPQATTAATVAAEAAVPVPPHPQQKRNSGLSIAFFARSFNRGLPSVFLF